MEQLSENTLRGYRADWNDFVSWWGQNTLPVPEHVVEQYLAWSKKAGFAFQTIRRRTLALAWKHRKADVYNPLEAPRIRDALARVRKNMVNEENEASRSWEPISDEDLRARLAAVEEDNELRAMRNRAIIALACSSNLRRSEIAALRYTMLEPTTRGLLIHPPRINAFRKKDGRPEFVDYRADEELCPWKLFELWTNAAAISSGPVFRPIDQWGNLEPNAICAKTVRRVILNASAPR